MHILREHVDGGLPQLVRNVRSSEVGHHGPGAGKDLLRKESRQGGPSEAAEDSTTGKEPPAAAEPEKEDGVSSIERPHSSTSLIRAARGAQKFMGGRLMV